MGFLLMLILLAGGGGSSPAPSEGGGDPEPDFEQDYSGFADSAALRADNTVFVESTSNTLISLSDEAPFPGGKSMLYTFEDRTSLGTTTGFDGYCADYSAIRDLRVPGTHKEWWFELMMKFSPNWTLGPHPSCLSNPDYKGWFVHVTVLDKVFRMDLQNGRVLYQLPVGTEFDSPNSFDPRDIFDGEWHRLRMHCKLSSDTDVADGSLQEWIDDFDLGLSDGHVLNGGHIDNMRLGHNLNQGPLEEQYVWRGRTRGWLSDPGWSTE